MSGTRSVLILGGHTGDEVELLDEQRKSVLPVDMLSRNLAEFMSALQDILPAADKTASGMGLKSVAVAVGINGKGQVGFLGTGTEVGGSATLTLTFER